MFAFHAASELNTSARWWMAGALPAHLDVELKRELDRTNPFESHQQRTARLKMARERELANILREMNGIEDATVRFDEQKRRPFQQECEVAAIVAVRPVEGTPLDPSRIRNLRRLVAGYKVGLRPEAVTVFDFETGRSFAGALDFDPSMRASDEYAVRKSRYEREWTEKIAKVLADMDGVRVATNVELQGGDLLPPPERASGVDAHPAPLPALVPVTISVAVGVPRSYLVEISRQRAKASDTHRPPHEPTMAAVEQEIHQQIRTLVGGLLPPG